MRKLLIFPVLAQLIKSINRKSFVLHYFQKGWTWEPMLLAFRVSHWYLQINPVSWKSADPHDSRYKGNFWLLCALALKLLCSWLRANKISLNASKTELIIFRDPKKKIRDEVKIKIDGKKLTPSPFVKYLGIYIDSHLTWNTHLAELSAKLSRAIGMLHKIRHFVIFDTLKMVYYGIFSSILTYGSQIWGQTNNVVSKLQILQNKAIRAITFNGPRASASPIYKDCIILKLTDHVNLLNYLFAHDSLNNNLPAPISGQLHLADQNHNLRNTNTSQLQRPQTRTIIYGSKSIKCKSIDIWNFIALNLNPEKLQQKSRSVCKNTVQKFMISRY